MCTSTKSVYYRGAEKSLARPTFVFISFDGDNISFDASLLYIYNYYYRYPALGPVWAETRAQSGDWYGSGTLHPGQVLRGSFPLLFPLFTRVGTLIVATIYFSTDTK